jgi:hypothetical protein
MKGRAEVLTKPLDLNQLLATVKRILTSKTLAVLWIVTRTALV